MTDREQTRRDWRISLPVGVWSQIVMAAQESEDSRLRALVERAVMDAVVVERVAP